MKSIEKTKPKIFLTDDKHHDCLLFLKALQEIFPLTETRLVTANDGVKLMQAPDDTVAPVPQIVFHDRNVPRKCGFERLAEIREYAKRKACPVAIFSRTSKNDGVNKTDHQGANYCLSKPKSCHTLKPAIELLLSLGLARPNQQPLRDNLVVNLA